MEGLRILYGRLGEGLAPKTVCFRHLRGVCLQMQESSAMQIGRFAFFTLELKLPSREHHFLH